MQLSEIVRDLCLRAGLSNADIDVTSLTDEVSGYVVSERKSLREMISVLQTAFFFDAVESGGILRFVKRGGGTIVAIDANDLGAAEGDGDRARIRIERAQDVELPISIDVVHLDEARDYQSSTVTGRRQLGTSRSMTTFSLPLILSVEEAQTIAQRALREIWQGRVTLEAKLPTRAIRIDPTDVIEVPVDGAIRRFRVTRVLDKGAREVEAVRAEAAIYAPPLNGIAPRTLIPPPIYGAAVLRLMDLPLLRVMNRARSSNSSNVIMSMLRFSRLNSSNVSRITLLALTSGEFENSLLDPITNTLLAFLVRAVKTSLPALL